MKGDKTMMTIKEYATKILRDAGCDEHSYYGVSKGSTIEDLETAFPNGMDFPYEDVATAILEISKPSIDQVPQIGFDFEDWGKWGIGDFYEDHEKELREAIDSGKPFNTGWHRWRKEEHSMCIIRNGDQTKIIVGDCMDSALEENDLFYDFLEGDEIDMLTDEKADEIRDYLICGDFVEEVGYDSCLKANATFDEIIKEACSLLDACHNRLHESFKEAIATTLEVLYGDSEETRKKIDERIAKCA